MITSAGKALIDPDAIIKKIGLVLGLRVADFGCGRTGHFIFPLAKIVGEAGIVYAVDILKDILAGIKSRAEANDFQNIKTIWSDVEKYGYTPIPEASLDACFFVNTLFLLKDKENAIKEALRLLKNSGLLVIIDWQKKLGTLGPKEGELATSDAVTGLAVSLGFRLSDSFSAGDYHYCLIFLK